MLFSGIVMAALLTPMFSPAARAATPYETAVLSDGPVAYYRLNETQGLTINDLTGANDGTYTGVNPPALGQPGATNDGDTAVAFSHPAGQTGDVPRTIQDDFTIEFWVKTTVSRGSDGDPWWLGDPLVDAEVCGGASDFGVTAVAGEVAFGGTPTDYTVYSTTRINDGVYHHVVATRIAATGAMQVFVDGVLEASGTNPFTGSLTDAPFIGLGQNPCGVGTHGATLDEVAFYTKVLAPERVSAHYAAASTPPAQDLTVTRSGLGSGTVTSAPAGIDCGLDCSESFANGTLVTLTATPAADSAFAGWNGGGCSVTDSCTVTMDAAKTVIATFEIAQRALTVVQAGGGDGTVTSSPGGIDCGADCTEAYAHGTLVTLTATAAPGSIFVGWSGICAGSGTCAITMDAAKTVTANFTPIPRSSRTLAVGKSGGGEGEVTSSPAGIDCGSDCTQVYDDGMTVTLTATPKGLSSFGSWTGCDRVTGKECVVTMNVDTTVTARFVAARTLTVERQGTGSGEVTSTPEGIDCGGQCEAEYVNGSEVVLTAVPGEGSTFGSWSGCDEISDDECTISLTSDAIVTVRFDRAAVVHERRVTLFLGRHLNAHGRVRVGEGPAACAAGVPVRIQRQTPAGWVTIERRTTSPDGTFRAPLPDRPDSYRVRAPSVKIDGGPDACKNAISPTREHGHK